MMIHAPRSIQRASAPQAPVPAGHRQGGEVWPDSFAAPSELICSERRRANVGDHRGWVVGDARTIRRCGRRCPAVDPRSVRTERPAPDMYAQPTAFLSTFIVTAVTTRRCAASAKPTPARPPRPAGKVRPEQSGQSTDRVRPSCLSLGSRQVGRQRPGLSFGGGPGLPRLSESRPGVLAYQGPGRGWAALSLSLPPTTLALGPVGRYLLVCRSRQKHRSWCGLDW